jgi:uncharacterized protein YceH (UPF0502 family)
MAVKTTLEQLEEVQEAITSTMAAQAYDWGDVEVKKANLKTLGDRERELLTRYYRETGQHRSRIRVNLSGGV